MYLKGTGCEDVSTSSGSGYRPVTDSCEHDNETLGFIKDGEFLD
jgi:hypothetical protein